MRIVVCYKNVPEELMIKVNADRTLDLSGADYKIGQYDLNAVEAAAGLAKEAGDSEIIALTVGADIVSNTKLQKAVLSRGTNRMIGVKDAALASPDVLTVAEIIKKAVEKIGGVDLVLFGEGSGDIYSQQTGTVTGALLGLPTINAVEKIELGEGTLRVSRSLEDGVEHLEVQLPAVISVTSDINIPRIPSMKDILGAGKKPCEIWSLDDLQADVASSTEIVSMLAPEAADRKKMIIEGDGDDEIEAFFQQIRKVL